MSNQELKPCPFCGSVDLSVELHTRDFNYVFCLSCQSEGPIAKPDELAAVEAWNRRLTESNQAGYSTGDKMATERLKQHYAEESELDNLEGK